jgi:hypothetical protein
MLRELPEPEKMALVVRGRALVCMIEAAKVLLTFSTTPNEHVTCGLACELAQEALRELIHDVEPDITAQIMVASSKGLGLCRM